VTALLSRLRLSVAELDLIARAADLAAFPGLPANVSGPATDGVVLDGLRARGIIEGEGEALKLREDVATLLGAILECDVSLQLASSAGGQTVETVVHLRDELAVLQRVHDGIVSLVVVLPDDLAPAVLSLCGEPDRGDGAEEPVRLSREDLLAAECGEGDAAPRLAGYVCSAVAPQRAGRAAARGTLYGETRAACAWMAGRGGTYVVHDRGTQAEIVRADGRALADELLSLAESPT